MPVTPDDGNHGWFIWPSCVLATTTLDCTSKKKNSRFYRFVSYV